MGKLKRLACFVGCFLGLTTSLWAPISTPLNITEQDGSPSTYPYKAKFSNGTVTDNGDGTVSISNSGGGGSPGGSNTQVQFNNAGAFGGSSTFTYTDASQTLELQDGTNFLDLTPTSLFQFGGNLSLFYGSGFLSIQDSGLLQTNTLSADNLNFSGAEGYISYLSTGIMSGQTANSSIGFITGGVRIGTGTLTSRGGSVQAGGLDLLYGVKSSTAVFSQVQVTSNTILSGATFYQDGTHTLIGPVRVGNQSSTFPLFTMLDVKATSNTFTEPHAGINWASRIISAANSSPTGGLEVIGDNSSSVNSSIFTAGDSAGNKYFEIDGGGNFFVLSTAYIVRTNGSYGVPAYLEYKNTSGFGSGTAELRVLGDGQEFVFGTNSNGVNNNGFIKQINNAPIDIYTNNKAISQFTANGNYSGTYGVVAATGTFTTSVTAGTTAGSGTQLYRCSGGTDAGWILYGNTGAAQTICTTGGGTLVSISYFAP
jgi:hypothetical protein